MLYLLLLSLLWYIIGVSGFIFWWTKDWDFTTEELFNSFLTGFLGPISWYFGWVIHGKSFNSMKKVLIKKRKRY